MSDADMCLCGHPRGDHGNYTKACQCLSFHAKEQPAGEQWQDELGINAKWFVHDSIGKRVGLGLKHGDKLMVLWDGAVDVCVYWIGKTEGMDRFRYQAIPEPTPPPAPLPKSRTIVLSAKVSGREKCWGTWLMGEDFELEVRFSDSKDKAVAWSHAFGIEPEIVDGGE